MLKKLCYRASGFAARKISKAGSKQSLSVLIYHQVLPQRDYLRPNEITSKEFEWQMDLLSTHFVPLGLGEALELLEKNQLPRGAVCVTFDDGYADNLQIAAPILNGYEVPATFFIATGFLNGGIMWNDVIIESVRSLSGAILDLSSEGLEQYPLVSETERLQSVRKLLNQVKYLSTDKRNEVIQHLQLLGPELPENLMMTDSQVKELDAAGFEIGGHTISHPILLNLDIEMAKQEIEGGKVYLESLLGKSVDYFAYPNGQWQKDYNQSHAALVRTAGYKAALSTNWGRYTKDKDPYMIPRFTPWDRTPYRFFMRLQMNIKG